MSVISYIDEDELDKEFQRQQEEEKQTKVKMVTPKLRVAICGPSKSGKTFILKTIEERYLQQFDNPLISYMHLNKLLNKFECSNNMFATQIRDYVSVNKTFQNMSQYLQHELEELNDNDLILIEDVRHDWEFDILRNYGFHFIYVFTKNEARLQRAKSLDEVKFMCSKHEVGLSEAVNDEVFMEDYIDILYKQGENFEFAIWKALMNKISDKTTV